MEHKMPSHVIFLIRRGRASLEHWGMGGGGGGIPHEILQVPLDKYWLDFHVLCLFENYTVNLIFCITQHLKTWNRISLQVRYEVADGRKDKMSTMCLQIRMIGNHNDIMNTKRPRKVLLKTRYHKQVTFCWSRSLCRP